jgi:imidazole glycerol-phosphate synthase subunit HisH
MNYSLPKVAIVDFGLGNLYSVRQACMHVNIDAEITSSKDVISKANAVILPGVGAYGDAMKALHRLDLVTVLRDFSQSEKPFLGICLGMQLLMSESHEFGTHRGLDIITGTVVPLGRPHVEARQLKVPQIGWNQIHSSENSKKWDNSILNGLSFGEYMYFVHSFMVKPENPNVTLAVTQYGDVSFCSSLQFGNIFACQFHPERSGKKGLQIYQNFAAFLDRAE